MPMKIAIDIGGVISKYPDIFRELNRALRVRAGTIEVHVVTDMHPIEGVLKTLEDNDIDVSPWRVHVADYGRHGDACKAVLLRDLQIDVFIDDHPGYLVWPWPTPAPLRLRVEPDPYRPYWHPGWKCEGGDFGRRVYLGGTR